MATRYLIKDYTAFKSTLVHELCHYVFMLESPYHKIESLNIWTNNDLDNHEGFFSGNVVSAVKNIDYNYYIPEIQMCIAGYYGALTICNYTDQRPSHSDFVKADQYINTYINEVLKVDNTLELRTKIMDDCVKHVIEQLKVNREVIEFVCDHILEDIADIDIAIDKGITIYNSEIRAWLDMYFEKQKHHFHLFKFRKEAHLFD